MLSQICCKKVSTAGIVIGSLGSTLSLLFLVVYWEVLSHLDKLAKYYVQIVEPKTSEEFAKKVITIIITLNLTVTFVNIITSSLLVAGIIKGRHLMIIPWLINTGISVLLSSICFLYFERTDFNSGAPLRTLIIVLSGFVLGFQFLVWCVIYSLFKTIQARQEDQRLLDDGSNGYPMYTHI